jgi:hypothetical protein
MIRFLNKRESNEDWSIPPDNNVHHYSQEEIKEVMREEFLHQSKIPTDNEKVFLKKGLLEDKSYVTKLLYCGSINGWVARNFHSLSDLKGPTLSLLKLTNGTSIGGYTKA